MVFITQSNSPVTKDVRLKTIHFFMIKILKEKEVQQIDIDHLSDINSKEFMELETNCSEKIYSF